MRTNRKALNAFLAKRARKPALAAEAMDHLDGFIRIADAGVYRLATVSTELAQRAARAVTDLTGRPCSVRLVSLRRPFPNDGGLAAAAYDTELQPRIWEQAARILRPKLADSVNEISSACLTELGSRDWEELWDILNAAFWCDSWHTIKEDIGIGLESSSQLKLHEGLHQAILGYLAAATIGDAGAMRRLSGLILILPRLLPLGEKIGEPGVWLVLAA